MKKIHFVKLDGDTAEFDLKLSDLPMVGDTFYFDEDDFIVEKRVFFAEQDTRYYVATTQRH